MRKEEKGMAEKTLIIGGVAGGATTAARLRRRNESMEIIMFERGEYISYANCGLPYYIGDVIKSRDALLLQTPQAMKKKFNIDVRVSSEVTKIFPDEKKILVKDLKNQQEYEETYDHLVLATGSSPLKPPIPGIDGEHIFTLWTVPDTDQIKSYLNEKQPKSAAVIGGGFIGLEMAENLHAAGLEVSIIEMQNQVMAPVDFEMANLLHENIRMNQVDLVLEDGVKSFDSQADGVTILLTSGKSIKVDMVLLSIGVRPNSQLAKDAGLKLNAKGGVVVDSYLKTSDDDIFAVGDVIEVDQFVTKEKTMVPLAGPANRQARILADNLTGSIKRYEGTQGTSVAKVFDLDVAAVGLNEKQLKASGKKKNEDYFTVLINQKSHAGYYPGATLLTLKLIFEKSGKILGAQIVGQSGVDKRIDTISVTMRLNGTVNDLTQLELAYAPPFSAAKDPVNMLGFVAENLLSHMVSFTEWDEVDEILSDETKRQKAIVLDVTEDVERMVYAINGSYHIPLGQLRNRLEELDPAKQIIVYCAVGVRAYNGARILMQNGFEQVSVLSGGISFYKSMHHLDRMKQQIEDAFTGQLVMEHGEKEEKMTNQPEKEMKIIDCCGLQCPGPIIKVYETMNEIENGQVLKVCATDMGFANDIAAWCKRTGNTLLKSERENKETVVYLKKGLSEEATQLQAASVQNPSNGSELPQGKTLVVFSGDLDKVLASFIIANGAASMGRPVTMFFTFWGLNALRKTNSPHVKKSVVEKMFGAMMPKGTKKLKLSKLNMAGMGTAMMKKVMNDKNVDSLETLMKTAMNNGVKLVACTMSMDIMGITKEELIDGVELAGVASYLGDAEEANVNLFV